MIRITRAAHHHHPRRRPHPFNKLPRYLAPRDAISLLPPAASTRPLGITRAHHKRRAPRQTPRQRGKPIRHERRDENRQPPRTPEMRARINFMNTRGARRQHPPAGRRHFALQTPAAQTPGMAAVARDQQPRPDRPVARSGTRHQSRERQRLIAVRGGKREESGPVADHWGNPINVASPHQSASPPREFFHLKRGPSVPHPRPPRQKNLPPLQLSAAIAGARSINVKFHSQNQNIMNSRIAALAAVTALPLAA